MGHPAPYQPHKLFLAVLFARSVDPASVRETIARVFGRIDAELPPRPFTFSSYYDDEMGNGLARMLCSIDALVDPQGFADLKRQSDAIERDTANASGGRTMNLDPGLLSLSRVMLASTKASAHRVPLSDGYFTELTLLFRHGRYTPFEWTYPDFRSAEFVSWLGDVRDRYHDQLRAIDAHRAWRL